MKPKALWKMAVDLAMTVLLFCLMAYLLVGETAHEWLGVAMFGLFLLHHGLNGHWHHNLAKGRYTPLRVFQTVVDVLILLAMAGLMVSGVILSRVVFSFLPISGGMGFARTLHMLASYWGFLFISLHLGLHWGVVMSVMRKAANKKKPLPPPAPGCCTLRRRCLPGLGPTPFSNTTLLPICCCAPTLFSLMWNSLWACSFWSIWA